jgi:hypothetical protein
MRRNNMGRIVAIYKGGVRRGYSGNRLVEG